jgi:large subunit ribosomal protein L5
MATAKGPKKTAGKAAGGKAPAKPKTQPKAKASAKAKPAAKAEAEAPVEAAPKAAAKPRAKGAAVAAAPAPRLMARYNDEVRGRLLSELGLKNVMEVPRLEKIVVNVGLGEAVANGKLLETAADEIATISGQRPIITRARKAIATFRLRKGMAIGCKVTLRGRRMYEFMDRLISLGLPRIRDFRGVSPKSFDGRGNYSLGVKEQLIFPEIDYEKTAGVHGMDIIFVTTARTDDQGRALLGALGMPFRGK